MSKESIEKFGTSVPMGRAGQPIEVATAFVYLTSSDASYIRCARPPRRVSGGAHHHHRSGQVFHVNGGVVIE